MATFAIRFPFVLANGKLASFQMRFKFPVLSAAEKQAIVNAACTEYQSEPLLFSTDLGLGRAELYEYERVPSLNPPGFKFQPTTVPIVAACAATSGAAITQSGAPQLSFGVKFSTPFAGGRFRGRVYTPPPPEAQLQPDGGVLDNAARVTWIREIAEAVEGQIPLGGVEHIVHSLTYGNETTVTSYVSDVLVDTQRRRRS